MNLVKYVGAQFAKPTGIGGKFSTFLMNRMNQIQYKSVMENLSEPVQDLFVIALFVVFLMHLGCGGHSLADARQERQATNVQKMQKWRVQ